MATKAEAARARVERERRGRKPKKAKKNGAQARARMQKEAAMYSSGHYAGGTASRNVKVDRADHETHDLEDSGSGRPSRKSTRKGGHHFKPDSQLRSRAVRRARSPAARRVRKARGAARSR